MEERPEAQIKNYAKATQRRSLDALRELAELSAGLPGACPDDWLAASECQALVVIILENVSGRVVEDCIHAYAPELLPQLRSPKHCARLATKLGCREVFGDHLWATLFPNNAPAPTQLPAGCPFARAVLSAEELLAHGYPTAPGSPGFEDSALWSGPGLLLLAVDCEMVETVEGSQLARIACVDHSLRPVYSQLVRPTAAVTDYISHVTGLSAACLAAPECKEREAVVEDLRLLIGPETVLVGHSLENDLVALKLVHRKVVDTAVLFPTGNGGKQSLRSLTQTYLRARIQSGVHDPLEDAKATMALARLKLELLAHFEPPSGGGSLLATALEAAGGLLRLDVCPANAQGPALPGAFAEVEDWRAGLQRVGVHAAGEGPRFVFARLRLRDEPLSGLEQLAQSLSTLSRRESRTTVAFATSCAHRAAGYDLFLLL